MAFQEMSSHWHDDNHTHGNDILMLDRSTIGTQVHRVLAVRFALGDIGLGIPRTIAVAEVMDAKVGVHVEHSNGILKMSMGLSRPIMRLLQFSTLGPPPYFRVGLSLSPLWL